MMPYDFSHYAPRYVASRQMDRCPVDSLIQRLLEVGVRLDSIVDFGAGTGFWIDAMTKFGLCRGKVLAIDVSKEMLDIARQNIADAEFVEGGVYELGQQDLSGMDCIFLCMVAHLLDFPKDMAELSRIASRNGIPHIVVIEEVSFFYHVLAGNPHYLQSLPAPLQRVMSAYIERRADLGLGLLSEERNAPFPMPSMSLSEWRGRGLELEGYRFETPENLSWSWQLSAADLVNEIQSRGYSICFCHDQAEALKIGNELRECFAGDSEFNVKQELPFWFNVHLFKIAQI